MRPIPWTKDLYKLLGLQLKILGFRNSGVAAAAAPLAIMPNEPLGEFVPSIPTALGSAKLEVLHPQGGTPVPENIARVPLNYKLRVQSEYFGFSFLEISSQEEESLSWHK